MSRILLLKDSEIECLYLRLKPAFFGNGKKNKQSSVEKGEGGGGGAIIPLCIIINPNKVQYMRHKLNRPCSFSLGRVFKGRSLNKF